MMISVRKLALIMLVFLTSHHSNASSGLEIEEAWIAEAPPVSKVMAAYMEIENETGNDRQAIAMQCDEFERAEFHRTAEIEGIARMEHQPSLTIRAHSELELEPGGYHIMLFNPRRRLRAGDETRCSMTFDDQSAVEFALTVKKSIVEDHSHHHH